MRRFSAITQGHRRIDAQALAQLEPCLDGRFHSALFYEHEAHVQPLAAMAFLHNAARQNGVISAGGEAIADAAWHIDCRGWAARDSLKSLRPVRGERLLLHSSDVQLFRPVRLLHPRIPFYIVPWGDGRFMTGATVIESGDEGEATLRSVFDLLSMAYAFNPAFAEARIVEIAAGIRPAFPDNFPKIIVRGQTLFVNGLYRHGFLLSPVLAELTAAYIERGEIVEGVVVEDRGEW
jgi:glycine oxidase